MNTTPLLIKVLADQAVYTKALVDSGCLCAAAFSLDFVHRLRSPRIPVERRRLQLADNTSPNNWITEISCVSLDIEGRAMKVWGYVIRNLSYDLILGKPWMENHDVVYLAKKRAIRFGSNRKGQVVREAGWLDAVAARRPELAALRSPEAGLVTGAVFAKIAQRAEKKRDTQIFGASLEDINRALQPSAKMTEKELRQQLPLQLQDRVALFRDDASTALPPNRPQYDTPVNLETDGEGGEKEVPCGPLYGMSRNELLVLRKTLTDYLGKGWIRASSSSGGAPVLFAQKPGGGLRFCVDYRALNAVTKRDRYPLPLIKETLRAVSKARWVTKVDVRTAFHRLRLRKGDKWKTAFCTRFGSFEWLVMPMGLAGAPASFQRYINGTLAQYLDDFCAAYLDDVLIYTDGSEADHWEKVQLVLQKLEAAGLQLDLKKCEFARKKVKYLGFIIELGKGISVDPDKVAAIKSWEAPANVKAVQSFVGFANFYRDFIPQFSNIAEPLLCLTRKGAPWNWGKAQRLAFHTLRDAFITAPVLGMWQEDQPTVLEADASGWATGGCLSQRDKEGRLRPVAYYSRKFLPAECNYDIHDKELLAIVRCFQEWRNMLVGVAQPVTVLSDHKNLRYFMTSRRLTERQVRWSQFLSQFNFRLEFRAGKNALRPDALSRRDQDLPQNASDDRLREREFQLLKDEWVKDSSQPAETCALNAASVENACLPPGSSVFTESDLQLLWDAGLDADEKTRTMYDALHQGARDFPPALRDWKVSIGECCLDERGVLLFRDSIWVPAYEPLQTALIQRAHDSAVTGHPGRDSTLAILRRSYYWPRISHAVRQFTRNCNV